MDDFYIINYAVVCFLLTVAVIFFVLSINKIFKLKEDYHTALVLLDVISFKIDYSGLVVDYTENFINFIQDFGFEGDPINKEFLNILKLNEEQREKVMIFINDLEIRNSASFTVNLEVKCEQRIFDFKGIVSKDTYGVSDYFLIVVKDITESTHLKSEMEYSKRENKNLYTELAGYEEELQRNFEHLDLFKNEITEIHRKHNLVLSSLDVGVVEYDFQDRQLRFSKVFIKQLALNNIDDKDNMTNDSILSRIIDNMNSDDYVNLISLLYETLLKKKGSFEFTYNYADNARFKLNGRAYYDNEEPTYIVAYLENAN